MKKFDHSNRGKKGGKSKEDAEELQNKIRR